MRQSIFSLLLVISFILAGCYTSSYSSDSGGASTESLLQKIADERSTQEVEIHDDPYEDWARVSTARYEYSLDSDIMLRGFIRRVSEEELVRGDSVGGVELTHTDRPSHQVYLRMQANDWHHWRDVRYMVGGELHRVDLERIDSDVSCGRYTCTHYEAMAGGIPRSHLDIWAESGDSVRVYSGRVSGHYQQLGISADEVQAYLSAVDSLALEYGVAEIAEP